MIEPRHILILKEIAMLGGAERFVKISTAELGRRMGISQQSASRWVKELCEHRLIERRKSGREMYLKLNRSGMEILKRELFVYYHIFGPPETITLVGEVITGLGEGKYYIMKHGYRTQIENKLMFTPFPGTLNVKVHPAYKENILEMRRRDGIKIEGFVENGRRYGNVIAYFCTINDYPAAVIIPEMSHYTDVVEIIADVNLREKIKLEDGSEVKIEVLL
ncbi:MAG: DUF120 domain-containing protein [Euryarchaeota archaeon]|nr:DUF120 domain-containing protein [Euryarchaeota archaeon]